MGLWLCTLPATGARVGVYDCGLVSALMLLYGLDVLIGDLGYVPYLGLAHVNAV